MLYLNAMGLGLAVLTSTVIARGISVNTTHLTTLSTATRVEDPALTSTTCLIPGGCGSTAIERPTQPGLTFNLTSSVTAGPEPIETSSCWIPGGCDATRVETTELAVTPTRTLGISSSITGKPTGSLTCWIPGGCGPTDVEAPSFPEMSIHARRSVNAIMPAVPTAPPTDNPEEDDRYIQWAKYYEQMDDYYMHLDAYHARLEEGYRRLSAQRDDLFHNPDKVIELAGKDCKDEDYPILGPIPKVPPYNQDPHHHDGPPN